MKKIILMFISVFMLAACGEDVVTENVANPSNGSDYITINSESIESEKVKELYNDLKDEIGLDLVHDKLIEIIAENELNIAQTPLLQEVYNNKAEEKILEISESEDYIWGGEFLEEYMARDLSNRLFDIDCSNGYGPVYNVEGTLIEEKLKCDYSDYIEKELKTEILLEMLEEKYIEEVYLVENDDYISRRNTRYVEYFKIESDDITSDYDFMNNAISLLVGGSTLEDIENLYYNEMIDDLDEEFAEITTSDDSNFSTYNSFTYNEEKDVYYTLEEGYDMKLRELYENELFHSEIINKTNKGTLPDSLNTTILENDYEDRVVDVNGGDYLVSNLASGEFDAGDIIIKDGSNFYFVKIVDLEDDLSLLDENMKEKVISFVEEETSLREEMLEYYVGSQQIDIHDEDLYEFMSEKYPSIFID